MSEIAPLQRVPIDDGMATLWDVGATERLLEVELRGRTFKAYWDPRVTGAFLLCQSFVWSTPSGEAIDDGDRDAVLDGLWALAPRTRGIRAILLRDAAAGAWVAQRWDRGPAGHLVQVAENVDVIELGRTTRMSYRRVPAPPTKPTALVDVAGARRVAPEERALTEDERSVLAAKIARTTRDDYVLTDFPFRFVVEHAPAAAPAPR